MRLACCICKDSKYEIFFKRINSFDLLKCRKCNLVFLKETSLSGDFVQDAKHDIKKNDSQKIEYWGFPELYNKYTDIFESFFEERLRRIKRYAPKFMSVFDIGCGYGFWLDYCRRQGLEVGGLDSSEEVIKWVKTHYQLSVSFSTLEEYNSPNRYDVLTMCDILEHLVDPNGQLQKVYSLMHQDSLLLLQVPDVIGFKLPLFHGYGLPHHLWQFNKNSLKLLLRENGFEILNYWAGIQGVIGAYESGGPSLFKRLTWQLAKTFKIGNRLIVLAKKEGQ